MCEYSLRFFLKEENAQLKKIVDLKILEYKISQQRKEEKRGVKRESEVNDIWIYMCQNNYRELEHVSELMRLYVDRYL